MASLPHLGLDDQALIRATLQSWLPAEWIPNLPEPDLVLSAAGFFKTGKFTISQRGLNGARVWYALLRAIFPAAPVSCCIINEQRAIYDLVKAVFDKAANPSLAAPSRTHDKNMLLRILSSYPKP